MDVQMEPSWEKVLGNEWTQDYFKALSEHVRKAYLGAEPVYPPPQLVFNAFLLCPFDRVKVVILGQDPYHGPEQAHGLSFSVPHGIPLPPSLRNIFKELHNDLGAPIPTSGDLTHWASQGVLLLNTSLTVVHGKPGSHTHLGWETFTDAVIQTLSDQKEHLVFMLWGTHAHKKQVLIDQTKHHILTASHPSPLSAHKGFFGCAHFSHTNAYLIHQGIPPISWY